MSEKKTEVKVDKAVKVEKSTVNTAAFIRKKLNVLNTKTGAKAEQAATHVVEVNRKVAN